MFTCIKTFQKYNWQRVISFQTWEVTLALLGIIYTYSICLQNFHIIDIAMKISPLNEYTRLDSALFKQIIKY